MVDSPAPHCEPFLDDPDLVARLAGGDTASLGRLYERYGAMVFALIRRVYPQLSTAAVEDLRQDTFVRLLQAVKRYREDGKTKAWILGVALNVARDEIRRSAWRRRLLDRDKEEGGAAHSARRASTPAEVACARIDAERLLMVLPVHQREVLVMNALMGMNADDIAVALDVRPRTVWTRLHRARRTIMRQCVSSAQSEGDPR